MDTQQTMTYVPGNVEAAQMHLRLGPDSGTTESVE
jgi:hypothetical protein